MFTCFQNLTLQQAEAFGTGFKPGDLFCCPQKEVPENCRLTIHRESTLLEKSRLKLSGLEQKTLSTKVAIMKAQSAVYTRWNSDTKIQKSITSIQKSAKITPCNISSMVTMYETIFAEMVGILQEAQEKLYQDLDHIERYYSSDSFAQDLEYNDPGKETFTDFTSADKWCARHFEKDYWANFLKTFV